MRGVFDTVWGRMAAEENGRAVTRFHLPGCIPDGFDGGQDASPLLRELKREVDGYIAGKRRGFTVPLEPAGTDFQQAAWRHLQQIPFGCLRAYKDIAAALGRPGATRAVGAACRANPLPLLIPCHRVVGSGGELTGFSGGGVEVKRRLIEHEQSYVSDTSA